MGHRPWPVWHGEPLHGKTLVLAAEQGLGDTIQAVLFADTVKQRFGGTILLQCQPRMIPLLSTVHGIDHCYERE